MNLNPEDLNFKMTEPDEHGPPTRYAFWLECDDPEVFKFTGRLLCVARVKMDRHDRGLIAIKDTFDADKAWHYIRIKLHEESHTVYLDPIWENALRWL